MHLFKHLLLVGAIFISSAGFTEDAGAPVNTTTPEQLQKWFDQGYQAFKKERYHNAVLQLHKFKINQHSDTLNSDWAMFFLALAYDRSGLTQAAVDTFNQLLKNQANPQIVNASLYRLEEISRTIPFDEALLIDQTVISLDFDYIDKELKPFILFSQGRYNWSKGFTQWGNEQFEKLPEDHYYQQKYHLLNAQRQVFSGNIDDAKKILETLVNSGKLADDLASEAQQFLARLTFEKQDYSLSAQQYQQALLNDNHEKSALLELAWATFLSDRSEKSFGLLYAFSAPSFANAFSPEYYILKTHIYKDHCHYDSAVATGADFFTRYQQALDGIYQRKNANDLSFESIHHVLLQDADISKQWDFANLLVNEKKNISLLWPKETKAELNRIYDLKIDYVRWQLLQSINKQFERIANGLLNYSEEMNLISYEMGVERFQRSPDSDQIAGTSAIKVKPSLAGKVKYNADGEFWTDELTDYIAVLSDDCLTTENWSAR